MRLDSGLSLQQEVGWDRATVRAARYIAQCQDQPFLVSSPSTARIQLSKWNDLFPTITPTVQAQAAPNLQENLHKLGLNFTFTNKSELSSLSQHDIDLSNTVFANSLKLGSHLKAAQGCGVSNVYCDSVDELRKIKKFHPKARVILELAPSSHQGELSSPSGAQTQDLFNIFGEAHKLGLTISGLALGLTCTGQEEDVSAVVSAVHQAKQVILLAQSFRYKVSLLHLGRLCLGCTTPSPQYITEVHSALAWCTSMQVHADASNWILAPSITLAARVIAVRERKDPKLPIQYYINEGVFGAFSSNLGGDTVASPLPLGGGRRRSAMTTRSCEAEILGPSGDELDRVVEEVVVPRMEEDDWLLFPCMGLASMDGFGDLQKVDGSKDGSIRLKEGKKFIEGTLPVELAWAPTTIINNLDVDLEGDRGKGEDEGGKDMGELELGKTFIWEDWCSM